MKKLQVACVIDDDNMFTYLVSKQMKQAGFCDRILVFNDGDEALNYFRPNIAIPDSLPSVILLDLNMPVLDGWQFLDEFTKFEIAKKITVYIVSSSVDPADHLRASTYEQVSDFYVKPITNATLGEMLMGVDA